MAEDPNRGLELQLDVTPLVLERYFQTRPKATVTRFLSDGADVDEKTARSVLVGTAKFDRRTVEKVARFLRRRPEQLLADVHKTPQTKTALDPDLQHLLSYQERGKIDDRELRTSIRNQLEYYLTLVSPASALRHRELLPRVVQVATVARALGELPPEMEATVRLSQSVVLDESGYSCRAVEIADQVRRAGKCCPELAAEAHIRLAAFYEHCGRSDLAVALLHDLPTWVTAASHPGVWRWSRYQLARNHLVRGDLIEASHWLKGLGEEEPSVVHQRGVLAIMCGDHDEALAQFNEEERLRLQEVGAKPHRSGEKPWAELTPQARCRRGAEESHRLAFTWRGRAAVYHLKNQLLEAIEEYVHALEVCRMWGLRRYSRQILASDGYQATVREFVSSGCRCWP